MNSQKVIKQYVRQCLMEIFKEMDLRGIIQEEVMKHIPAKTRSLRENIMPPQHVYQPQYVPQLQQPQYYGGQPTYGGPPQYAPAPLTRENIRARLQIDDDEWSSVYEDTFQSSHPIMNQPTTQGDGGLDPNADLELVPEQLMRHLPQLNQDFSRMLPELREAPSAGALSPDEFLKRQQAAGARTSADDQREYQKIINETRRRNAG